jgi:hypothetical protein
VTGERVVVAGQHPYDNAGLGPGGYGRMTQLRDHTCSKSLYGKANPLLTTLLAPAACLGGECQTAAMLASTGSRTTPVFD